MFDKLFGGNDEQEQDAQEQEPEPEAQEDGWTFDTVASIIAPIEDFYLMIRGIWEGSQRGDLLCTKGVMFTVALCTEWPHGAIGHLLGLYGIEIYNYGVVGDRQMFLVDKWNAAKTQAVLTAYGVPTGEDVQWKTSTEVQDKAEL